MNKIKFGTDGWRAIIAKDFTVENVLRVSQGVADWLLAKKSNPSIIIGYDCRFGGKLFAESAAKLFLEKNITVHFCDSIVSTPMISYGTILYKTDLGIMITASHNPGDYNGYKLKANFGGSLPVEHVEKIEGLINYSISHNSNSDKIENIKNPKLKHVNILDEYINHVKKNIDIDSIAKSGLKIAYDPMYGSGFYAFRKILPNVFEMHNTYNPSFGGTPPEPIEKNLQELIAYVKKNKYDIGVTTDGDADRIGLIDEDGNFVNSNSVILILIYYLHEFKKLNGKVCTTFSASSKITKIANLYNLPLEITKIGFKYISAIMEKEDVLIGGEESGGIAIKGHIPERDGIWIGLIILELMAKSKKSLKEILNDVYKLVGKYGNFRIDLHLTQNEKDSLMNNFTKEINSIGNLKVTKKETLDGVKYHFGNEEWLMIRASGTEPVVRVYSEAVSKERAIELIEEFKKTYLKK